MAFELTSLAQLTDPPFDQIIDVRSPAEFALDHLPGAINLPVLSNEERALVGTTYVQDSRFKARKMGAALVARNAARHLEGALADQPGGYLPLVYCWRGGQRSGSFASILAQIGWRVQLLEGGYRSYRRLVSNALYQQPMTTPVVILAGNTGTAKTDILLQLQRLGLQTIDLEGLANHRGSLFGGRAGGQPSQKAFESQLGIAMAALDPRRPVLIEAESSKVGNLYVPPSLWQAMQAAPRITLKVPLAERARYLTRAYRDLTDAADNLPTILDRLRALHSAETIEYWHQLAQDGAFEELATALMAEHYDPRYSRPDSDKFQKVEHALELEDLSGAGIKLAAVRILEILRQSPFT